MGRQNSSFRIGSIMLLKTEDGYSLKRMSLAGTGGQCLMLSAAVFFVGAALLGLVFAITNGVPINTKLVSNDGYNAMSLGKDKLALKSFWRQLKINEQQMAGVRLKDMPEEWVQLLSEIHGKFSIGNSYGVRHCQTGEG